MDGFVRVLVTLIPVSRETQRARVCRATITAVACTAYTVNQPFEPRSVACPFMTQE